MSPFGGGELEATPSGGMSEKERAGSRGLPEHYSGDW